MMKTQVFLICWLLIAAAFTCRAAETPERQIAITIDDLPAGDASAISAASMKEMTAKLVGILKQQKIPAVGFVNERKLYKWGEVDERIKALAMWLDAGLELGNHTFSHASLNRVGLKAWEEEIIQGETVTRLLLAEHNRKLRYFRHPYLDTGLDLQTRREAEAFLADRGYRVAPVTVDAWDWMFAGVYADARQHGDTALEQQIVQAYLVHTEEVLAYCEQLSRQLVGYEIKQVLLLHASWLEAEHVNEVLDVMRKRGYRFITLDEALTDLAYGQPDTYVGEVGTIWLDHWAITRGQPPQEPPLVPKWVQERWNQRQLPKSP